MAVKVPTRVRKPTPFSSSSLLAMKTILPDSAFGLSGVKLALEKQRTGLATAIADGQFNLAGKAHAVVSCLGPRGRSWRCFRFRVWCRIEEQKGPIAFVLRLEDQIHFSATGKSKLHLPPPRDFRLSALREDQ